MNQAKGPSQSEELRETNHPNLPSQYELCRIAAALRNADAVHNPDEALKAALRLWLSAGLELSAAQQRDAYNNAVAYRGEGDVNLLNNYIGFYEPDAEERRNRRTKAGIIEFGSEETSEAMKWVNDNARNPKDHFKTFSQFKKCWDDFFGKRAAKCRDRCSLFLLKRFLDARVEKRKGADAERKRNERQQTRGAKQLSK